MDETDLKYAEEQARDQQIAQGVQQGVKTAGSSFDSLSSGLAEHLSELDERRQKDKDSINNRGTNDDNIGRRHKKRDEDDDDDSGGKKKKKDSDLGDKDGLDDKKDKDSSDKKDKKDDKGDKLEHKDKEGLADKAADSEGGFFSSKINKLKFKIKATLIILAIGAGAFILFFLVAYFIQAYDYVFGSPSAFFGVSTADTEEGLSEDEADGLLTSEQYTTNPATGEDYSQEELIAYLKSDGGCKTTTMAKIMDWFDSWDGEYSNYCGYYRYIAKRMEELESEHSDSGLQLDRGLVVATLFYGFANQQDYFDYKDNVDMNSVPDITNSYNHYDSLESIINEGGVLSKKNMQTIVDSEVLDESHTYYTWEVEEELDDDGNVKKKIGKCVSSEVSYAHYSSLKWSILMRFGEEAANTFQKDMQYSHSFNSSDDECKMGMTDEELKERIVGSGDPNVPVSIDHSVRTANNKFSKQREAYDLSPFEQKANPETKEADIFEPYGDLELNYMNGFAFKNFPAFEKSINNSNLDIKYDYILTPKQIEEIIQNIIIKKQDVNYYIDFPDMDNNDYTQLGDFVIGANCEPYLTAAPDAIQVKVTDCDGTYITTTSFKDYIMGVAYGEVSDSGDNYVLSEMVAAISYSLHRRNNYLKGSTITMRSGNCDQVYCPMGQGCQSRKANLSCGSFKCTSYYPGGGNYHGRASQGLQDKYANYYETAKNYLVVSNGKPHSAHYVSSIQLGWKAKANRGIPFTQIIQEEYQDEGAQLVQCNGAESTGETPTSTTTETPTGPKVGNTPSDKYPEVAPSFGRFYGFAYNDAPEGRAITMDPAWKNANLVKINTNCSAGNWNHSYTINKAAKNEFAAAYKNMCKLITQGVTLSDGTLCKLSTSQLINGGTFVSRKTSSGSYSLHAYGIAQDWNYNLTINYNGKSYRPYASQGASTKAAYDKFVKAIGKEESCVNVNYILWKYAFKPAGFTWGGNWSTSSWDGMHFQVKY